MRMHAAAGLMVFLFAALANGPASADAIELSWHAPDECRDGASVERMVIERLGDSAQTRVASLSASGRVERTPSGYALELRTETGERRLEAADCEELAASAALILALLIDPQAGSTADRSAAPTNPPAPPVPGERARRFFARPELIADLGTLPRLGLGPGIALGVSLSATAFELSASYLPNQDVMAGDSRRVAVLRLFSARLGACHALLREPSLAPCLFVEYARMVGRGDEIQDPQPSAATVWTLLAALRLSLWLTGALHGLIELAAGLPVEGAEATVRSIGVVHETGVAVGRLRTGLELRF